MNQIITIMKKRTYIQPILETMVLPKGAMMDFPTSPTINPAPKRRTTTEVF